MQALPIAGLDGEDRELLSLAQAASELAYAPYSRLRVGAAVRTGSGRTYCGCNVENASFGLTCCAERVAVFNAVTAEGAGVRIEAIAVFADAHTVSPCGACRQVLAEFGDAARLIFPVGDNIGVAQLRELLPVPFEFEGLERHAPDVAGARE